MASHGVARTSRTRTVEQRQQELDKISKYQALEGQVRQQIAASHFGSDTFQLTSKLLRLNPEYYTLWNTRRRCLLSGQLSKPLDESLSIALPNSSQNTKLMASCRAEPLASSSTGIPQTATTTGVCGSATDPNQEADATNKVNIDRDQNTIRSELGFIVPLLMEHPKCYWIWNYRMWILQLAIERLPILFTKAIWEEELGLVGRMLLKDSRNYHAWAYRRYVIAQLESPALVGHSMAEAEFHYTTDKIHSDLSNFSAWHNRSQLICRVLDERGANDIARKTFLEEELTLVGGALNVGPEDQSLWYYHRFLVLNVVNENTQPAVAPQLTREERLSLVAKEMDIIKELLEDYDDIKWIYETLIEYQLASWRLQNRPAKCDKKSDVAQWLSRLRTLDCMRKGRWDDMELELGIV